MRQLVRFFGSAARPVYSASRDLRRAIASRPFSVVSAAFLIALGCSDTPPEETTGTSHAALSPSVLAFESLADWEGPFGTLSLSDVHTEGQHSILVSNSSNTWTDVLSVPLGAFNGTPTAVSFKFQVTQTPSTWETVKITFDSQSQNLNFQDFPGNQQTLASLNTTAGEWKTVTFSLGSLGSTLAGLSDVRVRISVNLNGQVYLDDMQFAGLGSQGSGGTGSGGAANGGSTSGGSSAGGTASGGAAACIPSIGTPADAVGDSGEIVLQFPKGIAPDKVMFAAQGGDLRINDGSLLLQDAAGVQPISTQIGTGAVTEIGSNAWTGRVVSQSPVTVRSQGTVNGPLTSGGSVTLQAGALVNGTIIQNATNLTPPESVRIPYAFPAVMQSGQNVQNGANVTLQPGGYQATQISGSTGTAVSTLTLSKGTYYFDSLNLQPGSKLRINNAEGAVTIFVRNLLHLTGDIEYQDPTRYNVLYAGLANVEVGGSYPFRGIVVAPNALVNLYSAPRGLEWVSDYHAGSFFAKDLHVHQWTRRQHHPFKRNDCASLCDCATAFGCDPAECPTSGTGGSGGGTGGAGTGATGGSGEPTHCTNGSKDSDETDVDCGGSCGDCDAGKTCSSDEDCAGDLVCPENNGACFGLARGVRVCWAATCVLGNPGRECGSATSACGENCSCVTPCDAADPNSVCPDGEECRADAGLALGGTSRDACLPQSICPSNDPAHCGGVDSDCGPCICTPDCSAATCADPSDNCGGECPGICGPNEEGCTDSLHCPPGYACLDDVCRPGFCPFRILTPPLCGHPGAPCGEQCPACAAQCDGRTCGPDPNCGASCGTCDAGSYCNIDGQCVTPEAKEPILVPDGNGGTRELAPLDPPITRTAGALRGQFSVSEQGRPEYTIPIDVPPGRAGIQPSLALKYVGDKKNGDEGMGWRLEGFAKITRCPRIFALDGYARPVKNDPQDRFCLDGQRLVAVDGAYGADWTEYRTFADSFSKITSHQDAGEGLQLDAYKILPEALRVARSAQGPDSFKVRTKDGRILTFGGTRDSLVMKATGVRHAWLLTRIEDRAGNWMSIGYTNQSANVPNSIRSFPNLVRPLKISYTGHGNTAGSREVLFDYEPRGDTQTLFLQGGVPSISPERLSRITTYLDGSPVKNYRLHYGEGTASQIEEIYECAGADHVTCKRPTKFEYVEESGFTAGVPGASGIELNSAGRLDLNGDGFPDLLTAHLDSAAIPVNKWMGGAQIAADVGSTAAAVILDYYYPGVGTAGNILWTVSKDAFWGLFTHAPKHTMKYGRLFGTGQRGEPFGALHSLPTSSMYNCGLPAPTVFLDYNQDGTDDVMTVCSSPSIYGGYDTTIRRRSFNISLGDAFPGPKPEDALVIDPVFGPEPVLIDVDGDGLHDIVSCKNATTLEVRRRLPLASNVPFAPKDNFRDPITLVQEEIPFCSLFPTYNVLDVDGDGLQDLLARGNEGWGVLRYSVDSGQQATLAFEDVHFSDAGPSRYGKGLSLGDFNGDGLLDAWLTQGDKATIWLNTGGGRFLSTPLSRPQPLFDDFKYKHSVALDYDADGRDDILEFWRAEPQNLSFALIPSSNVGELNGVAANDILAPSDEPGVPPRSGLWEAAGDIDGDGNADLYGGSHTFYGSGTKNKLLKRVTDGQNNVVSIGYDANDSSDGVYTSDEACLNVQWPEKCLPRVRGLVASHAEGVLTSSGQVNAERLYSYAYVNARVNVTGHGWLGFDRRSVTRSTVPSTGSDTVTTEYANKERYTPNGALQVATTPPYFYPLAGLPTAVTIDRTPSIDAASPLEEAPFARRTRVESVWDVALSASERPYPRLRMRVTRDFARDVPGVLEEPLPFITNGRLAGECWETLGYDLAGFGNVVSRSESCQSVNLPTVVNPVPPAAETTRETISFDPNPTLWLIANPSQVTVQSVASDGTSDTRTWAFTYYANGLLRTVTRAPGSTTEQHRTTYERDTFGNVDRVVEQVLSGEGPRATAISYDVGNIYPAAITNSLGHTTQLSYDERWGAQTAVVDPNGIAIQSSYDGFGRLVERRTPEGDTMYMLSELDLQGPLGIEVVVDTQGKEGTHSGQRALQFDSYGRPVGVRLEGLEGVEVLQGREYDARGRVVRETLPHTASVSTPPIEQYEYDFLDRITKVVHADGTLAENQYAMSATLASDQYLDGLSCVAGVPVARCAFGVRLSIDESGQKNLVITDHRGRVVRNIDGGHIGTAISTNYKYGSFGNLAEARDNVGNVTRFFYDPAGRMLVHVDPDTGSNVFEYNGYDEVVSSAEPGEAVRTFEYDDLGRRISVEDSAGTTRWVYDEGTSALGRLSSTISPTLQTIIYKYEAATATRHRGLLEGMEAVLDGIAYPMSVSYDDLGRPKSVHYPEMGTGAPIVAEYTYDSASGALVGLDDVGGASTRPLWHMTEAFQGYMPQRETFGTRASTTSSYDSNRLWLDGIETTVDGESVQALDFTRHENGQLKTQSIGSGASALTREYAYGATGNLDHAVVKLPGESPLTTTFGIDTIGNRTSTTSGAAITYENGRKHFIDAVGANSYDYYPNGNVMQRTGPDIPGGTQSFEYTPFDLPKKITSGTQETSFDYSADEERVLRRDQNATRYFVAGFYQRVLDNVGSTLEERFSLFAAGRAIGEIVRTPSGETVLYFHSDSRGTVNVLSTDMGDTYHRDYDEWGAPLFGTNDELTRVGFTGHQHDADLGLIDMRGRIYDPLAGRFLTPDPIMQAPFWSQGLNRYSYVFNDPVNNVDPSGFSANDTISAIIGGIVYEGHATVAGATIGRFTAGGSSGGLIMGDIALGSYNVFQTVNDPRFGGGYAGSSSSVPLTSSPDSVTLDPSSYDPLDTVFGRSITLPELSGPGQTPFDDGTEARLATLRPDLQLLARRHLEIMRNWGFDPRITHLGGARTAAGQKQAGAQTAIAASVGNSAHEYGAGYDIALFFEGRPIDVKDPYGLESYLILQEIAAGAELGLQLGPSGDYGHFQLPNWRKLPDLKVYKGPQL